MGLTTLRPEREIQAAILALLASLHIVAWRANTGAVKAVYKGQSRFIRFGLKGQADILGILPPTGRALAIEVKRPGQPVTPYQVAFLDMVRRAGGIAFVATSPDDVLRQLEGVR